MKKFKQVVYRSAKTGRFVSKKVAVKRPSTTVKEVIKREV
jgi:signal recognition particle subunit SEC65